jgi:non-canonical purine NTP pyrophosphatase (RdgB/HAM1 family)
MSSILFFQKILLLNIMLLYITGNQHKVDTANDHLESFGVSVEGMKVEGIIEPQAEDIVEVSISKAKQAFEKVKRPLIVSDASWMFSALNGFPGAYMHDVNNWFTPNDFLRLMEGIENREIVLRECVTYIDEKQFKTFVCDSKGIVLKEAHGEGSSLDQVVSFKDDMKSIAQCENEGILRIAQNELWEELGEWLKENKIS